MRIGKIGPALAALAAATIAWAHAPAVSESSPGIVRIVIETDRGSIDVDLDSAHAPRTVANFLRYVDGGFYTRGQFHRTVTPSNQPRDSVRIEVIQGGPNPARTDAYPPIELERTRETSIRHHDGTLSMARASPNSATADFFICLGEQPALDYGGHRNLDGQGFAAFGRVTTGMEVVRQIQRAPADGQRLTPPVNIRRIRRADAH